MHHSRSHVRTALQFGAAILAFGSIASAQLTTTGPFTGTDSDSFETQDTSGGPFPPCVVDRAFNNKADLCTPSGAAHITGGWGFSCSMAPHAGGRLYGSTGGASVFTFDDSASRFGGYFGTHNPSVSDGVVNFYDAGGTLLFSDVITAPNNCTWTWNGWDFGSMSVKSIEILSNYSSGGFMLLDSMEADIVPATTGTSFCFGDGTGAVCPCGNIGAAGEGCANSGGTGATLAGSGVASIANDSFALTVAGVSGAKPGLVIRGANQISVLAGDGLLCVGGNTARSQVQVTSAGGTVFTDFQGAGFGASSYGAGVPTNYQFWYRDPQGSPCGGDFNLTNGLSIVWQP